MKTSHRITMRSSRETTAETEEPLIPGLPDDVAEECLLRIPFPYGASARCVSSAWHRALVRVRPTVPHLFVLTSATGASPRLVALDLLSRRWLLLPSPATAPLASTALPRSAELLLLGSSAAHSPNLTYRAATNAWSAAAPSTSPLPFLSAFAIGGRIYAAATGSDDQISSIHAYDPEASLWTPSTPLCRGISRYDVAAIGRRIYMTEGWAWPFTARPRGVIYDVDRDTWTEMAPGMAEGWTGAAAVVGGRVFVASETGEGRLKVYKDDTDTWQAVSGGGVLGDVRKPFVVAGTEETCGWLFVVGNGLDTGIGKLVDEGNRFRVQWEVVKGPKDLADLCPFSAHLLYV